MLSAKILINGKKKMDSKLLWTSKKAVILVIYFGLLDPFYY